MPILYPASNRFKYARSASDFRARRYAIQNPPPEPAGYDPIQDFANGEQGFIYDIQDLSTLFQDVAGTIPAVVGLSVARINDKSGNGNHAIQVTPTSRAILRFVDGKYWLQTDGADDWYITPTITPGTDKAQVFVGLRKLSDAAAIVIEASINYVNSGNALILYTDQKVNVGDSALSGQGCAVSSSIYSAPVTLVASATIDRAGTTQESTFTSLRVNSVDNRASYSTFRDSTGNYGSYPFYLFRRGGLTLPLSGMISSMVLRFGPNLTPEQIANMNAWANERAGAYL